MSQAPGRVRQQGRTSQPPRSKIDAACPPIARATAATRGQTTGPVVGIRFWTNQARANWAAWSSVPGSSNRWVAPGTIASSLSRRSWAWACRLRSMTMSLEPVRDQRWYSTLGEFPVRRGCRTERRSWITCSTRSIVSASLRSGARKASRSHPDASSPPLHARRAQRGLRRVRERR